MKRVSLFFALLAAAILCVPAYADEPSIPSDTQPLAIVQQTPMQAGDENAPVLKDVKLVNEDGQHRIIKTWETAPGYDPDLLVADASPPPASSAAVGISPDDIWQQDETVTYNAFTLPEKAALDESGCIGVLAIPKIGLTVNVYEAEDEMEAMDKGAAHFRSTSAWDGNVGLSAHNVNLNGTDGYFKNLYTLKVGDTLSYETALGGRVYEVTKVKTISADDWSELSRSTENRVTLITCISGQPEKRLMVQAAEK